VEQSCRYSRKTNGFAAVCLRSQPPNPLPILYQRGTPPFQKFRQFSVWLSTSFSRTSQNPCDMQFCLVFSHSARSRTGVANIGVGPNFGLVVCGTLGPTSGARGPPPVGPGPTAHLWPVLAVRGPFWPVLWPFVAVFSMPLVGPTRSFSPTSSGPSRPVCASRYPYPPGFGPF